MATSVEAGVRLGDPSPDWALPRLDGGDLKLQSLRGRKVLLFFWGSW